MFQMDMSRTMPALLTRMSRRPNSPKALAVDGGTEVVDDHDGTVLGQFESVSAADAVAGPSDGCDLA